MRRIHSPVLLANIEDARARAFVVLFTCDAFARAVLISLVPLQAYDLLGAARLVSVVYFLIGVLGLAANLTVPLVLDRLKRRWVLTLGAGAQMASAVLFALGTTVSLVAGLALQVFAMAVLDVVINLYLLDHIPRRGLNHFEPRRLLSAGTAFALGPWIGVYLNRNVAGSLPYILAMLSTLTLLTYFWTLRLADNPSLQAAVASPPSPLRFLSRFIAQPRLVLSWLLALGRNGWWVMNFIYTPIFVTNAGYRPETGGALVSLGLAPMLLVRVWGRLGQAIGIRNLLCLGYALTGTLSLAAAAAAALDAPLACMALMCLAAFSATVIDGAGNVPFLRAVHHYERAAMTSVFMTFRHVGSLVVPGALAIVLWVLPLWGVFAVAGLMTLAMAGLSRYLPQRL
jgi:MFS family permease